MAILKCKMCGGELSFEANETVCECEYCGSKQTVPLIDDEKKVKLYERANKLRLNCEFDKAAGVYENIVADFSDDAEAYWGLILCTYGIEYVDDPNTGKKIPTCHRSSFESVMDDENFEMVMENADSVARAIYREEAKVIEEIRKGIIEISGKEEPYDIFICYKETDENGERTIDSVLAQDVYDELTAKGYKVFFSRITLEDKLGMEYEPYIFAALNSAKVMLAFGTSYDHYNAVWVKNEWSRYLKLMAKDKDKHLIPCFKGIDAYDIPKEFARLQAQDMGKLGFMQDLTRGITKIIRGSVEQTPAAHTSIGALTKRGYFFLEDGDFKNADDYFEKALDENPEDSKAYAGKVLAGLHIKDITKINDRIVKLYEDKNYERAIRFASGAEKVQLEAIKELADKKWFVKCLTVGLKQYAIKKEIEPINQKVATLAALATADAYDEIVGIYETYDEKVRNSEDAYTCRMRRSYFDASRVEAARVQAQIIRVLMDEEEHTLASLRANIPAEWILIPEYRITEWLNEMIQAGSVEKGLLGGYCIVGSTEKRKQKKNREMLEEFERAERLMEKATVEKDYQMFFAAAKLFSSLNGFKGATSKTSECRRLGEKLQAEAKAEQELQALKKKQKLENAQKTIALGGNHLIGLKSDGTVVATGKNTKGQCNVLDWRNIVAIDAGDDYTVGLKTDGTVVATGDNHYGQCNVSKWRDMVSVSSGHDYVVGLKANGTVVAAGNNALGQCNVSDWRDIVNICVGSAHTVGLKKDGTVVAVGYNKQWQCDVSKWRNIVAISAGNNYTVGLYKDGSVVVTGGYIKPELKVVSDWRDIVAISAGYVRTVGLKSDGTVLATPRFQIRNSITHTEDSRFHFEDKNNISSWRNIVAINAGRSCEVGLKEDGTIVINKNDSNVKFHLSDWKLFDSWESYDREREIKMKELREKEEEIERRKPIYRSQGLCQHCGGSFKGLFMKTCTKCGKTKDY